MGSLSGSVLWKGTAKSLTSLVNFLWCLEWGGDIHEKSARAFLLKSSFSTAKVLQDTYNRHNSANLYKFYVLAGKLYNPFHTSLKFFCFTENYITEMRPQVIRQKPFSHCRVENEGVFPNFPFALLWLQANASVTGTAQSKLNLYGLVTMTVKPF